MTTPTKENLSSPRGRGPGDVGRKTLGSRLRGNDKVRWQVRLIRILLYAALGLTLLGALLLLGLATPPGRAAFARIVAQAASADGIVVTIGTVSGWPPFDFAADKIVVADTDGPFAEIDNLRADLRVSALQRGTVAFETLVADRLSIVRRPKLPDRKQDDANVSFAIDAFSIARMEIGEALAGRAAVLSASGAFASGANGGLYATVAGERTDGVPGKLTAAVRRADRAAPYAVNVNAEEAAGGILVGLLGLPSGPGYRLVARSEVTGDAVAGSLMLASTGAAHFDGRFTLSAIAGARRLELTGAGDLAELVPADYVDVLSGPIAVAIDADWAAARSGQTLPRITIRKGTLRTANVSAEAAGALGDAAADLRLKVDIAKRGGGAIRLPESVMARTRFDSIALTGNVVPAENAARLELAGRIAGLHVADISAPQAELSFSLASAGRDTRARAKLPFALRVEAGRIDTPAGRIPSTAGVPLLFKAEGTFDTAKAVADIGATLAIEDSRTTFAGTLSGTEGKGTATAIFPDLRPLGRFTGHPLSGALDATADGIFFSKSGATLKLQAHALNLDPGMPALARLLAGTTQFAASVNRKADGVLSMSGISLTGTALKATGRVAVGAATIDAALDGRLADLALLADGVSGATLFTLNASGARERPTVDATLRLDKGSIMGKPIEKVSARVQGKPSDAGWAGTLALDGNYAGKRLAGNANASLDTASGLLAFPRIDVTVGDNRITGALQRTAQGPLAGTLDVTAPDIATLATLALVEATGAANARIVLAPNGARQSLAVTFTASRLGYATLATGKAEGDVNIDDAFGTPRIRGNVTAAALTIGDLRLDSAKASAAVEGGVTKFTVAAQNPDLDLASSGNLASETGASIVTIATLTGSAYRLPLRLAAPVTIRLDGTQVNIAGARLAVGGGTVRIDGAVSPELKLAVVADKIAASTANTFAPQLGAEGTLSFRATITGKPAAPAYTWQVDWSDVRVAATRNAGLPAFALAARGEGTLASTSIDAKLTGAGGLSFAVAGKIPFSGTGLALRAEGTAPLALLALESTRELRLGGAARADLSVAGALDAPQITGIADLVEATIADADTGFGVTGATGRIAFDGKRATLQQVTGRLVQGGQIAIGGSIDVVGAGLPAAITVRIDNGRYADGRVINAMFDANLALNGPLLGSGTISGTLALGRTEIQLPEKLGGAATAIDVRHINASPGFKPPLPRPESAAAGGKVGAGSLKLAIEVSNTRGIFVRGFGVDAEFGGTLRVAGTSGSPQAVGNFTMRRGRIELLGKRFNLASGILTFAGDLIPLVEFTATAATTNATVTLNVSGPADDPKISFTSSPEMPQEEVLSRLLFDRSVGTLSPLQAVQLVDAVAQLTGVAGSGGIFGRIRQATGLDDLDVRQNASGGTTVGVSKGINDNVRLGVEAGSGTSAGRLTIDLELTRNLKARGEAGQDGSGKIGLSFEKEY
jgi:translocation and assembly module TamB